MKPRDIASLRNAEEDGLQPLELLDLDRFSDFDEMLMAMSKTAFGGRQLGEALDVLEAMVTDPDCLVVGTFSGAMTVAKMGGLITKMIDQGWLNVIVSTGALMAHGFIESLGMKHFKYEFGQMNDKELFKVGYNRVYDTLEPENNFTQAEQVVDKVLNEISGQKHLCSETLCAAIGRHLAENYEGPGILKSAYLRKVPVFIPAFTDSELALDVASNILRRNIHLQSLDFDPTELPFQFNPFMDLFNYTKRILAAKRIGIFTIGGGVPRNWTQQVGPFLEMLTQRVTEMKSETRRFHYGVRICPEPVHWGGLSGCTYQEGISWGKFVSPQEGGRFSEVPCDATIAWPILLKGLDQRLSKRASAS
jgi:deoxyhypusine synthase